MSEQTAIHATESAIERGNESLARARLTEKVALLEEFNRLLIESTGDCILIVDSEGLVHSINAAGRELLELSSEAAALKHHWTSLFPGFEGKSLSGKLPPGRSRATFQATSRSSAGEPRFWSITFSTVGNGDPGSRFLLIARDTTEHMLAERALRQSEQAFRKIFEENPIGMLIAGLDYCASRVNNAFSAMLGFSQPEVERRDVREWLLPRDAMEKDLERLLRGEVASLQREQTLHTRRGLPVWGHLTISVLRGPENEPSSLLLLLENIQDRKTAEEQVLAYQAQLQSLASELALSEEHERRRIATTLHDRIGQTLAFARLKLAGAIEKQREQVVRDVRALIDQAIADTRSLTFELSPPVLYELGLVAAIEWLARKFQQEHHISTRFHDDGVAKPLDEKIRIVLFQSVRELLVNVAKHAGATHVQVLVRRDADALRLVIEDDGSGFELSKVRSQRETAKSFGLFNVRERIEYLGGHVKISSGPGRGTRVTLIAPLQLEPGGLP